MAIAEIGLFPAWSHRALFYFQLMDRKEITLDELAERIQKQGPNVVMGQVKVSGIAVIKDKDGNIKSEMKITSLELNEDSHADCNSGS
jgi:hypothetical protein